MTLNQLPPIFCFTLTVSISRGFIFPQSIFSYSLDVGIPASNSMFVVKCDWKRFKPSCRICFFLLHLTWLFSYPTLVLIGWSTSQSITFATFPHFFFAVALLILKVRITLPTGQSASFSITHINFLSYSMLPVGFDLGCVASTNRVKSGHEKEKNRDFKMAGIWRLVAIFISSYNLMTPKCLNHCSSDQYAVAIKMERMTEGRMGQWHKQGIK